MESIKYITTQPHEMDNNLLERYIDYIEKRHACSPRDDPLRSRNFLIKESKIKPNKDNIRQHYFAIRDQVIIGNAHAGYTRREDDKNPDQIWIYVFVLPEYRRNGTGATLFDKIVDFGTKEGRLTFISGLFPIDGDDGPKFLEAKGMVPKLSEKVSRLYKDKVNWDFVNSSFEKLETKFSKYTLVSLDGVEWANKVLSDDNFAIESADFSTEIDALLPFEEVERVPEVFTIVDERRWAEETLKTAELWNNRNYYLYDDKRILAMSGTYFPNDPPVRDVGTGLTGVRKAYHRQGMATYLKIKILKYYMENHPDFEYLYTENATSNEGMLGINISLGFKPTYDWQMYQGNLKDK